MATQLGIDVAPNFAYAAVPIGFGAQLATMHVIGTTQRQVGPERHVQREQHPNFHTLLPNRFWLQPPKVQSPRLIQICCNFEATLGNSGSFLAVFYL